MAEARRKWGWSRDVIHDRTGITDRSQRAIERGQRGSVHTQTLDGIVEGFGLSRDQLQRILAGEDVPVPDTPPREAASREDGEQALWDELTDLRRRLVESETRTQIRLDEMQAKLRRLVDGP